MQRRHFKQATSFKIGSTLSLKKLGNKPLGFHQAKSKRTCLEKLGGPTPHRI